jgi:preprotein translocase subunit Sec61beta
MEPNKLTPEGAMTIGALIAALIILSIVIAS